MKHARIAGDYYATPAWCVRALLENVWLGTGFDVLDPSCGTGEILDECAGKHGATTRGIELDTERAHVARSRGHRVEIGDALSLEWPRAHAIVGNPPYSLALQFAERCAQWAAQHRNPAALLLRLSFLEGKSRSAFHRQYPSQVFVLAERPRFRTDTRGTDASAYAWIVWGTQDTGRWSVIEREST